ncbi:hypothetical protein [Endozoicomonas sp.]|uniref:hypothetical protein n=1 Tax=Endozoicomonas sp. TaxID=1892382 RepID=UPI003AF58EE0
MYVMHKPSYVPRSKPLKDIQEEIVTRDANGKSHYKTHKRLKDSKKPERFSEFKARLKSRSISGRSSSMLISSCNASKKQSEKGLESRAIEKRKSDETVITEPASKKLKLDTPEDCSSANTIRIHP